jgi:hypothetical protein
VKENRVNHVISIVSAALNLLVKDDEGARPATRM